VFYGLNVRKLVIHIEPQPDITECPAPCQI
jgi:hypothetical protein